MQTNSRDCEFHVELRKKFYFRDPSPVIMLHSQVGEYTTTTEYKKWEFKKRMERSRGVDLELTLKICIQLLQNGEQKHVCVLLCVCVCVCVWKKDYKTMLQ